jgi:phosphoribosylformylglycinamidine synthase
MAFAGHVGVTLNAGALKGNLIDALFNEELGAVLQVKKADLKAVFEAFAAVGLGDTVSEIGTLNDTYNLVIGDYAEGLSDLRAIWSDTTRRIAALRDNPDCAESEYTLKLEQDNPGITPKVTFDVAAGAKVVKDYASRPKMAILREQGVNGELEMAAAFQNAGFESIDVHMTDILEGRISLKDFNGLVASATVTCSVPVKAGPRASSSTRRPAPNSRLTSTARTLLRSASATAARWSPTSRT